jgi:bifunctional ADP-heptose synthase (sugar kinase/adenylyltransferase)
VVIFAYGKGVIGFKVLKKTIFLARKCKLLIAVDPKIEHFKIQKSCGNNFKRKRSCWKNECKNVKTDEDITRHLAEKFSKL